MVISLEWRVWDKVLRHVGKNIIVGSHNSFVLKHKTPFWVWNEFIMKIHCNTRKSRTCDAITLLHVHVLKHDVTMKTFKKNKNKKKPKKCNKSFKDRSVIFGVWGLQQPLDSHMQIINTVYCVQINPLWSDKRGNKNSSNVSATTNQTEVWLI